MSRKGLRNRYLSMPVTSAELAAIDRAAAHEGLKRATWARLKLLQAVASVLPGRKRQGAVGGTKEISEETASS